jgi:AraC family transcriptional activator FtrA
MPHPVAVISADSTSYLALCHTAFIPARGYALETVETQGPYEKLAAARSIVVCAWERDGAAPVGLLAALRAAHARGARLCAIGGGVLLLAEAGLLDGRRAATAPDCLERLCAYVNVDVRPDALLIDAGDVLTASDEGARAALLRMVETDCGADGAAQLDAAWEDGAAPGIGTGMPALLDYLLAHPAEACDEAAMARRAGLAPAAFQQRFIAATGMAPAAWLAAQRAALLRRLLKG